MRSALPWTLAALVLWPAAVQAQTTFRVDAAAVSEADGALTALREEYAAAASARDARRVAAVYAPDAIAVPTDGVLLRGAEQILRYSHESFAAASPSAAVVTLVPQQLRTSGRIASEIGTFSESSPDGPSASGVYVTIYTRGGDGAWRIAMEARSRGRDKPVVAW